MEVNMSVIVFLEIGGATVLRNVANRLSHNTEIQDWQSDKNIQILEKGSGVINQGSIYSTGKGDEKHTQTACRKT
jgi:hypothetical protein